MRKRLLSVILVLLLCFTMLPVASLAVVTADQDPVTMHYELTDSYGDGWNGASITVTDTTDPSAEVQSLTVSDTEESGDLAIVPEHVYEFTWVSGSWDGECAFTFYINEEEVFSGTGLSYRDEDVLFTYDTVNGVVVIEGYDLYICGVRVTSENAADLSVIDGVTGTVSYNPDTETLTLANAVINGDGFPNYGDYATVAVGEDIGTLNIAFSGSNEIRAVNNTASYHVALGGLWTNIVFTGADEESLLTIGAGNESDENGAMRVYSVRMMSGTVMCVAPEQYHATGYQNNPFAASLQSESKALRMSGGQFICKGYAPIVTNATEEAGLDTMLGANVVLQASTNYDGSELEDYDFETNGFYDEDEKFHSTYRYVVATPGEGGEPEDYPLFICREQVTSLNADDLSVIGGVSGIVFYDVDTNTLVLDGAVVSCSGDMEDVCAAIYYCGDDPFTIKAYGENFVGMTGDASVGESAAVFVGHYGGYETADVDAADALSVDVTIDLTENAQLVLSGGPVIGEVTDSCGFGNETAGTTYLIGDGALLCRADDSAMFTYGMFVSGDLVVDFGENGGAICTCPAVRSSCGVFANGDIAVLGGTLLGIAGNGDNEHTVEDSIGVYAGGSVLVDGGALGAHSGNAENSFAVFGTSLIQIDSGAIEAYAEGGEDTEDCIGIYAGEGGKFVMNDGEVLVVSGTGSTSSFAILSSLGGPAINGGTLEAYTVSEVDGDYQRALNTGAILGEGVTAGGCAAYADDAEFEEYDPDENDTYKYVVSPFPTEEDDNKLPTPDVTIQVDDDGTLTISGLTDGSTYRVYFPDGGSADMVAEGTELTLFEIVPGLYGIQEIAEEGSDKEDSDIFEFEIEDEEEPENKVAAPEFSLPTGTYKTAQLVSVYCITADADVYVISNDTEPVLYTGPISVEETVTLKAYAVKEGMEDSEIVTATYTIDPGLEPGGEPVIEPGDPVISPVMWAVSVKNGTGSGVYSDGDTVSIKAATAPRGQKFDHWTVTDGVELVDANAANTTFVMIAKNVTVTAVFVADPSVGEDPGPGYGWYYGGADISPAPAKDKEKDKEDVAVTVAPVVLPFDDVPKNSPYYEAIADVYGRGLMFGTSASLFSPELPLSRGMLTTLLWRLEGKPLVEFRGVFRDVPADEWYSDSVEWAASAGIVEGYGDGRYGVDDDLTWEQLITILYRYAKMKGYITGDVSYAMSGVLDVSEWASEAVCWAMHEGFLKGVSNVKAPCTREGIANTIHLFLDRYNVR